MIPSSYRVQEACKNCRHCFWYCNYEEWEDPRLFCNFSDDRPLCGLWGMGEEFWRDLPNGPNVSGEEWWRNNAAKWEAWAAVHLVDFCGICDEYEAQPDDKD